MKSFDLEGYLSSGVEQVIAGIMKATAKNPKESLFLMQYLLDSRKARRIRKACADAGEHIPPFLIASITTQCNLHCQGCYARANHSCQDGIDGKHPMLTGEAWGRIFDQAAELGIGFILLAGGEPFLRTDVLEQAALHKNILFPVFTNGTMLTDAALDLLGRSRNLIPVLSIEGNEQTTDLRRGNGIYQTLVRSMQRLNKKGIVFAASVTVTKENLAETLSEDFVTALAEQGCKGIVYVEYVPVDAAAKAQALDDTARADMMNRLNALRECRKDMVLLAFPGDERSSGGCLAAGRGFFHINAFGGAEPCPFSPYSDVNVTEVGLRKALQSPLFVRLRENGNLEAEHIGGCVLFEQEQEVRKLLEEPDDDQRTHCR